MNNDIEELKKKMEEAQQYLGDYFIEKQLQFFAIVRDPSDLTKGALISNMEKSLVKETFDKLSEAGAFEEPEQKTPPRADH